MRAPIQRFLSPPPLPEKKNSRSFPTSQSGIHAPQPFRPCSGPLITRPRFTGPRLSKKDPNCRSTLQDEVSQIQQEENFFVFDDRTRIWQYLSTMWIESLTAQLVSCLSFILIYINCSDTLRTGPDLSNLFTSSTCLVRIHETRFPHCFTRTQYGWNMCEDLPEGRIKELYIDLQKEIGD